MLGQSARHGNKRSQRDPRDSLLKRGSGRNAKLTRLILRGGGGLSAPCHREEKRTTGAAVLCSRTTGASPHIFSCFSSLSPRVSRLLHTQTNRASPRKRFIFLNVGDYVWSAVFFRGAVTCTCAVLAAYLYFRIRSRNVK